MAGRRSREKGKRGEREVAKLLTEMGFPSRRGQQFSGVEGKDVIGPDGFHIEVKLQESLSLPAAVRQAVSDANGTDIPLVIHRSSRQPWLVTMALGDLTDAVVKLYLSLAEES